MQTFFLAMVGCPEVQEKAHKELDAVVGSRRLPTFEDLTSLPYVTAIIKETARWQVVTPIGLPHRTIQDDEYDGYFIPKGSNVLANLWYTPSRPLPSQLTLPLTGPSLATHSSIPIQRSSTRIAS